MLCYFLLRNPSGSGVLCWMERREAHLRRLAALRASLSRREHHLFLCRSRPSDSERDDPQLDRERREFSEFLEDRGLFSGDRKSSHLCIQRYRNDEFAMQSLSSLWVLKFLPGFLSGEETGTDKNRHIFLQNNKYLIR